MIRFVFQGEEQSFQIPFYQKRTSHHPHDFINVPFNFQFVLDNGNQTIRADCRINLCSYSVFGLSPESGYSKVLFYPFEKQFHLPSVFVEEHDFFRRKNEVVGVECERPMQIRYVGCNSSDFPRVVFHVASHKSDRFVSENIAFVIEVNARFHHVPWVSFFSYDKENVKLFYTVKTLQVPLPTVKYVTSMWFVFNHIHSFDVMNSRFSDMNHFGYLCNDVKLCMELYTRLCASEVRPLENAHAKVYSGGIKCVVFAFYAELATDSGTLYLTNHVICELLENTPIPIRVAPGNNGSVYTTLTETQMKGFLFVGGRNIREFPKATASIKLSKHKDKQLAPVRQLPTQCWIWNTDLDAFSYHTFKFSFWQKVNHLAENVSSCIHEMTNLRMSPNIINSKVRQLFETVNTA